MREGKIVRRFVPGAAITAGVVLACVLGSVRLVGASMQRSSADRSSGAFAAEAAPVGEAAARVAEGGDRGELGPAFTDDGSPGTPPPGAPDRGGNHPERRSSSRPGDGPRLLVDIRRDVAMTARPGAGRTVGLVPARSRYYRAPTIAWIQHVSSDGRFGRLAVPYSASGRSGWIPLRGLRRHRTALQVHVSLSSHRLDVERRGRLLVRAPAATGSPASPTPRGHYFVTDRVSFPSGGYLGTFAFGLSGIQPNLPPGWSGGDQLAIHGTNDPSSIGRSASAGCVRVSDDTLDRLRRLVRLGTPVIVGP